ncbi:MAG TPA: PKD domain-containing protein, partial [candidate division Zixibacteria bacterium]|nr:PKD domain-containing protein [candidate division Zixibacteria bacterium]
AVVEELSWADIDGEGLEMYADTFQADGKRLHYLKLTPVQSIDSVSIDGTILPISEYSFQPQDGWISTAVDVSVRTIVYYTYSTTSDLVESNWDVSNMAFANTRLPSLRMYVDTNFGWAPLQVQFADSSEGAISWLWRFGDSDSSMSQNPTHVYSSPGSFGIYHGAQFPDRYHQRYQANMVTVLADTLVGDTVNTSPGQKIELDVYARNTIPIRQITLPVEYTGTLGLTMDSFSIAGCRTESFEVATYLHYDPWNKRVTIKLQASAVEGATPDLPAGAGTVAKLFFSLNQAAPVGASTPIMIDGYDSYQPIFRSSRLTFTPKLTSGLISTGACCVGLRGNIDGSADGNVDISDLIYLVDYSFSDGPEPPCTEEADVNGDRAVDISDVIYLVDYSFGDGPAPVSCP